MDNEFEDNGFGENVVPIDDLLLVKYVVVSLNGQNGDWFECFENKKDAEHELYTEHYEFGELELMTWDEFLNAYLYTEEDFDADKQLDPEEFDYGDVLAFNGEVLEESEWYDELGGYLHFPVGK